MLIEYKVIILKHGIHTTMAKARTLVEADKIKDNILSCCSFSGKSVIIEKTETVKGVISTTPFTGIDLTR